MDEPKSLETVPLVSDAAIGLATEFAKNDITKFRFKSGCCMVFSGVLLFLIAHLKITAALFLPEFTERSWTITKWMVWIGVALAGKEVVEGIVSGIKSVAKDGAKP